MTDFSVYDWSELTPADAPSPRWGQAMIWDGTRVLLFGGRYGDTMYNDTWVYESGNWTQLAPVTSPSARYKHVMAWDGTRVLMLGGFTTGSVGSGFFDTWEFVAGNWNHLTPAHSPGSIWGVALTWDGTRFLLSYPTGSTPNQTWQYAAADWTQITTTGTMEAFYLDDVAAAWLGSEWLIATGLYSNGHARNTTWSYNTATDTWTQVMTATPAGGVLGAGDGGRSLARMIGVSGEAILFGGDRRQVGGLGDPPQDDTWLYSAADWAQLAPAHQPPARWGQSMVWDGSRILMFGGESNFFDGVNHYEFGDTWQFAPPSRHLFLNTEPHMIPLRNPHMSVA